MKKYKIVVAYDGTDFLGWQVQPDQKTVAGVLQDTFKHVFGKSILITGASRTDAGVHAVGQTAAFTVDLNIDAQDLRHAWQNVLPDSIVLRSIEEVSLDFNPRAQVKQKTYYYHFFSERPLPMSARYGYYYRYPINPEKLYQALSVFVGTHDFRSFCTGDDYESTVRTIDAIDVEPLEWFDGLTTSGHCAQSLARTELVEGCVRIKGYRIIIKGPGFLRYMIRRIVGACLEVASRDSLSCDDLKKALAEKNPLQLLPTAPAKGLLLYKIVYCSQE